MEKGNAIDNILKASIQFCYYYLYFVIQFRQITESARLRRFVDILKWDNRLIICNSTSDCLENVKRTGNVVFAAVRRRVKNQEII